MNAETLPLTISEVDINDPVPSPFLPGTQIQMAWDATSLSYFKTCPRLYYYIMIEGWRPKDESVHLTFGQYYHSALEQYDRARAEGLSHVDAMREAVGLAVELSANFHADRESKAGRYKNRDTLLALVVDYLDKFRDDQAETVRLEDGTPAVELSFRFELDWGPAAGQNAVWEASWSSSPDEKVIVGKAPEQPYLLCGHLDRVVDFAGGLFVMDRKTTTTTIGGYYFDRYEPDNQMSLYSLAAQVILNSPVRGVIIDAAQIKLEEPHAFARGMTFRTPDQLNEWIEDLRFHLAEAERYATEGRWPMRDTSCGNYGGCRFRDICSKSPGVRERFLESKFTREEERWNPLKPR